MFLPDCKKTILITERENYYYDVMSLRLKNVGATYQRLMDKVFRQQIEKCMDVYVDDNDRLKPLS